VLERFGGKFVNWECNQLHGLVRERHRGAVNGNPLPAWRDAGCAEFRVHNLVEGDAAVIAA
jgi:hypothetical protein